MDKQLRILYVDDSAFDRELVSHALDAEQGAFDLALAKSREEFEKLLPQGPWDLVLSDFNILGYEGLQVLDTVKHLHPGLPVVIVTGTGSEEVAVEALKRGASDYVIKTANHIQRLPGTIRAALEHQRLAVDRDKSIAEMEATLEATADGILVVDNAGHVVHSNARFRKLWQIPDDLMASGTLNDLLEFAKDQLADPEGFLSLARTSYRSDPRTFDLLKFKDGRVVERRSEPQIMDGKRIGRVVSFRDISEKIQAERDLQKSMSLLQATLESTADGLLVVDNQRKVKGANRKFQEMWRIPKEVIESGDDAKLLASVLDQLVDPEAFIGVVESLYTRERETSEDYLHFKDGRVFDRYSQPQFVDGVAVGRVWSFRDITARKAAEAAAQQSSERYMGLIHSLEGIVWEADAETLQFTFVSAQAERLLGYPCGQWLSEPDFWRDHIHPADRAAAVDYCLEAIAKKVPHQFEYRMIAQDGHELWLRDIVTIHEEEGRPLILRGVMVDITSSRAQAQAIARMTQLYAALSQINQAIVWVKTQDELFAKICEALVEFGKFKMAWIGWNDPGLSTVSILNEYGDAGGYLQGATVRSDDTPEGRGPTGRAIREAQPCVVNDFMESPITRPWADNAAKSGFGASAAFPIRLGGNVCGALTVYAAEKDFFGAEEIELLLETATDISFALDHLRGEHLRQQAEEAVKKAKEDFTNTFRSSPTAISINALTDGRYLDVNAAWERLSGFSREEAIGKTLLDLQIWTDAKEKETALLQVKAQGRASNMECHFRAKDGSSLTCLLSLEVIEFAGQPCFLSTAIDVTERNKMEEALRESESRFRLMFERTADALLLLDATTHQFIDCNQAAADMLRCVDKQEMLSLHPSKLSPPHQPDGRPSDEKAEDMINTALRNGSHRFEWIHRSAHREDFPVEVLLTPVLLGEQRMIITTWRDITERKQAETILRERESRLRTIVDTEPECVKLLSSDGALLEMNPAGLRMVEADSLEQLQEHGLLPLVITEDRAAFLDLTRRVFEGESGMLEFQVVGLKGAKRWLETHASPLRDDSGRVTALLGVSRDITDRKASEEALRKVTRAVEQSPAVIVITDTRGRIEYVNPKFTEITGYTSAEVMGKNPRFLKSGEMDPGVYTQLWKTITSGEVWEGNFYNRKKDGGFFWKHSRVSPIRDAAGIITGFVDVGEDITAIRQADAEMLKLSTAIEQSANSVVITDVAGVITYVNPAFEVMTGYTRAEAIGNRPKMVQSGRHDAAFYAGLWATILGGGTFHNTFINLRKNGELFYEEKTIAPLKDDRGDITHFVSTGQDITARMQAEEALQGSQATLRSFFDGAPFQMGITELAADGDVILVSVNAAAAESMGLTPEETQGKHISELGLPGPQKGIWVDEYEEALRTRLPVHFEQQSPLPGSDHWWAVTLACIGEGPAGLPRFSYVVEDITERRRTERIEAAQHQISEAAQTTTSLTELFQRIHEIAGQLLPAKNFFVALYDDEKDEVAYPYFVDEFDPPPPPRKLNDGTLSGRVIKTGASLLVTPEVREETTDPGVPIFGSESIDWLGVPLKVPTGTIGALVVQSYTGDVRYTTKDQILLEFVSGQVSTAIERKRAEEALKNSEARYRLLFEQNQAGVFRTRPDGHILECNEAFAQILGYGSRDEVMAVNARAFYFDDEERQSYLAELRAHGTVSNFVTHLRRKDGHEVWVMETVNLLRNEHGLPEVIQGTFIDFTDRKEAEELLQRNEERFRHMIENSSDGLIVIQPPGHIIYASQSASSILGFSALELAQMNFRDHIHPEDLPNLLADSQDNLIPHPGETFIIQYRFQRKDGAWVWLESARTNWLADPSIGGIVANFRDITDRKLEDQLEQDRSLILEQVAQNQPLPAILTRIATLIEAQIPEWRSSILLLKEGRLRIGAAPHLPEAYSQALEGQFIGPSAGTCGTACYRGEAVFTEDIATDPLWDDYRELAMPHGLRACWAMPIPSSEGGVLGSFAIYRDRPGRPKAHDLESMGMATRLAAVAIEHRLLTDQLEHQAQHDSLTGLPNRLLFRDRLSQALSRAERKQHQVAVLYLDLDRFKQINDTLGHSLGDALLRQAAGRLDACVRKSDTLARLGGDEFTVVVTELSDPQDAMRVAQKIIETLRVPFLVEGHELFVSASLGISIFPEDGSNGETLMANADVAMYRAKEVGRDNFQWFASDMNALARERMDLESQLRHAIELGQLSLHYQPQCGPTGKIQGFEALLRWDHPIFGSVSPARFIPLAEESGLIVPMGEWVLREACAQTAAWRKAGHTSLRMAVNVSAVQFKRTDWVDTVRRALRDTRLAPEALELEITESLLLQSVSETSANLFELRDLGVGVAIDDFGTGYSSLSYLHKLPITTLKIDQSFVREIGVQIVEGQEEAPIIRTIIALAHNLGMAVVAEGVETEVQRELLLRLGCESLQGFLLHRPLTAKQIEEILKAILKKPSSRLKNTKGKPTPSPKPKTKAQVKTKAKTKAKAKAKPVKVQAVKSKPPKAMATMDLKRRAADKPKPKAAKATLKKH